jgi:(2Fe-2S) ferredoxin
MTAPSSLVVVGMSVREVGVRDQLAVVAGRHQGSVAFLQMGDPSLSRELTRLADRGARRIVLAGVSLGSLAPANSWLRRIAAHWWRERAGHRPVIAVAGALLGGGGLACVEAELPAAVAGARELTGTEPGLTSAAWERVRGHRHQVLVCRGPRCTAAGSDGTAEALIMALVEHGQGDDDVLVTHTGCQFPCNQAPVISVQPDDVWYGEVDPSVAGRIVSEHLVGGRPVENCRLPR